jgi:hypothetical protein
MTTIIIYWILSILVIALLGLASRVDRLEERVFRLELSAAKTKNHVRTD